MNDKLKNTRVVTFTEDYFSKPGREGKEQPIYKKGSAHAIHVMLVAKLKDKGAKFTSKEFDEQGAVKRAQAQLAKNRKSETTYA